MDTAKVERITGAVGDLLAQEKLTAEEFCGVMGRLMINVGTGLYRSFFPDADPRDLNQVEENYLHQPNYGAALLLEGHMLASAGMDNDHTDSGDLGAAGSEPISERSN